MGEGEGGPSSNCSRHPPKVSPFIVSNSFITFQHKENTPF